MYTTSLLEIDCFLWVCHNNDYTSIGYKFSSTVINFINLCSWLCAIHISLSINKCLLSRDR